MSFSGRKLREDSVERRDEIIGVGAREAHRRLELEDVLVGSVGAQ